VRARLGAVAETVATLAVLAWIGGLVTLDALAAPTLFHEQPRALAAPAMNSIFGKFDSLTAMALVLLVLATLARLWTLGLAARADRIAVGAALALILLGLLDVAYIHREIAALYAADNTLDSRFGQLHALSRRSAHLEVLATILMLGGFAFARRRPA
jgi:hypothetical protein